MLSLVYELTILLSFPHLNILRIINLMNSMKSPIFSYLTFFNYCFNKSFMTRDILYFFKYTFYYDLIP